MKFFFLVMLILNFYACGGSNKDNSVTNIAPLPISIELGEGNYSIPCFQNKLASQGIGITIYSKATLTLGANAMGSNFFELYDDAACTNLLANGTVLVNHYETVLVNGEFVLKMEQDDGNSIMSLWIGYKQLGNAYFLDLNFSDGESGPYLAEPTTQELSQFAADPAGQGILIQKI